MTVPKRGPRLLGLFVFLGCIALSIGGVWYLKTGGWSEDEQETDDDDEEATGIRVDGGESRHRSKKKTAAPRPKKKPSESRQARSGAPPHPGGATPPTGPS